MTKAILSVLTSLYLTSCNSGQASNEKPLSDTTVQATGDNMPNKITPDTIQNTTTGNNPADSLKNRLKGAWTDGSTENATFDITDKTIYYVDQGSDFTYSLKGDIITIKYPDYTYNAKLSFQSDTLIMDSKEYGQTKFWKFKN
ncbi:MAG: hypothetical protein GXC73_17245 [Chitinophagaceae bacterium]|nr:hypothetical protein [Chitinophagaceae bacterium]